MAQRDDNEQVRGRYGGDLEQAAGVAARAAPAKSVEPQSCCNPYRMMRGPLDHQADGKDAPRQAQ